MFEVVSSSFESRLYFDLENPDTGEIHRLIHIGRRCRNSPVLVAIYSCQPLQTTMRMGRRDAVAAKSLCQLRV